MNWHGKIVAGLLAALLVFLGAEHASAQRRGYDARPGTTIQLPQFNVNSVTTTVTAPDRGTVLLGGIKSLSESRNEYGVPILGKVPFLGRGFRNVGFGRDVSSGMMTVTPYIHDFEALERELLGGAPSGATASARSRGSSNLASGRARETARQQFAEVQRPRRDTIASRAVELRDLEGGEQAEAELYFSKAHAAYKQGNLGTSRIYLRMAANCASGDLRDRVLYAQNALDPSKAALAGR